MKLLGHAYSMHFLKESNKDPIQFQNQGPTLHNNSQHTTQALKVTQDDSSSPAPPKGAKKKGNTF